MQFSTTVSEDFKRTDSLRATSDLQAVRQRLQLFGRQAPANPEREMGKEPKPLPPLPCRPEVLKTTCCAPPWGS